MVRKGSSQENFPLFKYTYTCRRYVFSSTHAISPQSRPHQSEIGTVKQRRGGLREREVPLVGVTEGQSHGPQTQSAPFVASRRLDLETPVPLAVPGRSKIAVARSVAETRDQKPETRNHGELSQERTIQQGGRAGIPSRSATVPTRWPHHLGCWRRVPSREKKGVFRSHLASIWQPAAARRPIPTYRV